MTQTEISLMVMLFFAAVAAGGLVWSRIRPTKRKQHKNSREKHRSKHFMKLINEGFRVYDGYFFHVGECQGGDYPARFSILSRKPMNKKSMQKLTPVSNGYVGVVKNVNISDCKYITFNGSDVYCFDGTTGKTRKADDIYFERDITRCLTSDK